MFVASRMTKHPVSITSDATIQQADRLMKKNKFHRMLVVDDGKLVGYFSDRDIMRVAPSPATTLSKFEIRSLLDKISVRDIMHEKVITVNENATIEEAALIMYQNKVGGLPVVSDVGALVGIITATDILKTFINVMGLIGGKTRLTIEVDNKVGVMAEITKIFADNGINIDSFITCRHKNNRYELVVRLDDHAALEDVKKLLNARGYKVVHSVKIGQVFIMKKKILASLKLWVKAMFIQAQNKKIPRDLHGGAANVGIKPFWFIADRIVTGVDAYTLNKIFFGDDYDVQIRAQQFGRFGLRTQPSTAIGLRFCQSN